MMVNYITYIRDRITYTNKISSSMFTGSNYRYLSSNLDKNSHRSRLIKKYISYFITLIVVTSIPYLVDITIINYLQGLTCMLLVIIMYIMARSYYLGMEGSNLSIVPGYIDGVISSIVKESLIPDYFTCILIFIGLFMLLYYLTLDNKNSLSIWSKIKQIWVNKCILLSLGMLFFFLSIILSYFGILIINKDSFILFILTAFSRIVFYKLMFAIISSSFTRDINSNLFSLNIFTVLFILGIVYCNIFIVFPIISSTFYLWYNDLYTMENLSITIKNNLKIYIQSCEKHVSFFTKWLYKCSVTMLDIYKNFSSFIIEYVLPTPIYCSSPTLSNEAFGTLNMLINPRGTNSEQIDDPGESFSNKSTSLSNRTRLFRPRVSKINIGYTYSDLDKEISFSESDNTPTDDHTKITYQKDVNTEDNSNVNEQQKKGRLINENKRKYNQEINHHKQKIRKMAMVKTAENNKNKYINSLEKKGLTKKEVEIALKEPLIPSYQDEKPIWLEDLNGNRIGFYLSIKKGANDLGVQRNSLSSALKLDAKVTCKLNHGNDQTTFGHKYKVREMNLHDENLPQEVKDKIKKPNATTGTAISITDSKGNTSVMPSIKAVCKHFNIDRHPFRDKYLDKNVGFKHNMEVYIFRRGDFTDKHFSGEVFERVKKLKTTPVWATDSTGYTKVFQSIKDASIFFKQPYLNFFNTYLDKNNSILKGTESYKITRGKILDPNRTYSDNQTIGNTPSLNTPITVNASKGKYEIKFSSLTDAAKYFKIDHKEIELIVDKKTAKVIKGEFYSFRKN